MRLGRRSSLPSSSGENPFWITYSDLLSSLVMVFLVLLLAFQALTMQQLKQANAGRLEAEQLRQAAEVYRKQAYDLGLDDDAEDLASLRTNLEGLQKDIPYLRIHRATSEVLIPDRILFGSGTAELSAEGKRELKRVIPLWASIVTREEYRGLIQEVVFEGHADTRGDVDRGLNYLQNLGLTLQRAESVTRFVFSPEWSFPHEQDLRRLVTTSGRSNVVALRQFSEEVRVRRPGLSDEQVWRMAHATDSSKNRRVGLRLTFKNPLLRWEPKGRAAR